MISLFNWFKTNKKLRDENKDLRRKIELLTGTHTIVKHNIIESERHIQKFVCSMRSDFVHDPTYLKKQIACKMGLYLENIIEFDVEPVDCSSEIRVTGKLYLALKEGVDLNCLD